jgi:hypothetical protein
LFFGSRGLGISISPGLYGSGATRIEADLSINRGEKLMRRASTYLALLGLAVLALPAAAVAAPIITLTPKVVPLAGFPGTGYHLGKGAAVEFKFSIKGSESTGGVPSQLTGVKVYLPKGTKINEKGFVKCAPATLENIGPEGCPKKSQASPVGSAGVVDPIGGVDIRENAEVQAFFAPGGGLEFYANAAAPISAQLIAATGKYITGPAPYGPEFVGSVAVIDSVPGAPPVSTESIKLKVGAAYKKGKKVYSYGTVPTKCPKGGFPFKAEMTFATGEVSTIASKLPCPKN